LRAVPKAKRLEADRAVVRKTVAMALTNGDRCLGAFAGNWSSPNIRDLILILGLDRFYRKLYRIPPETPVMLPIQESQAVSRC
jgi:hypothetical protein